MKLVKVLVSLLITVLLFGSCKKRHEYLNNRVVPHDFLSSGTFEELVVEIDYVSGYEPDGEAINKVVTFLQSRLNKPAGISIVKNSIPAWEATSYSINDLFDMEKKYRGEITKNKKLTAYVLFLDKEYAGDGGNNTKTLGIMYGSSSMALFENVIRTYGGGIAQPKVSDLEASVFEHEFGHVLGLTNNGTPMQTNHQDNAHGGHCNNKKCLMYYTAETSDIISNILGEGIPQLDENCLADLKANGGK